MYQKLILSEGKSTIPSDQSPSRVGETLRTTLRLLTLGLLLVGVYFVGVFVGIRIAPKTESKPEAVVVVPANNAVPTPTQVLPELNPEIGVLFRDQNKEDCFEGLVSFGVREGYTVEISSPNGYEEHLPFSFTITQIKTDSALALIGNGNLPFEVKADKVLAVDALGDDGRGIVLITKIEDGNVFVMEACGLNLGLGIPDKPEIPSDGET